MTTQYQMPGAPLPQQPAAPVAPAAPAAPAAAPAPAAAYAPAPAPAAAPAAPYPTPAAPQPAPAAAPPAQAPAYAPPAATTPAPAAAQPGYPAAAPMGGAPGMAPPAMPGMANQVMQNLANASVSEQRRNLIDGSAIYVVSSVQFVITRAQKHMDKFFLHCLIPIQDGSGLKYGEQGYNGPIPGVEYEYPIFRDYQFNYHTRNWLDIVKCFAGWDAATLKQYQSTPEGQQELLRYTQAFIGFDFTANQPIQSVLAGNYACEINQQTTRKQKKKDKIPLTDPQTGQPVMGDYPNVYFNRNVPVAEVWEALGGTPEGAERVYRAFGSKEIFEAAYHLQSQSA